MDADAVGRLFEEYGVDRSGQNSEGWRAVQIATAADDDVIIQVLNVGIGQVGERE